MATDSISAHSAKWFVQQLIPMGISLHRILKGTDLSGDWLNDESELIKPVQYLKIVENALDESNDPSLGLKLGKKENLADEGIWGYAILSSPTLGEANQIAMQFWELNGALVKVSCERGDDVGTWDVFPAFPIPSRRLWIFAVEELLSTFYFAADFLSNGNFQYANIHLSYPEPEHSHLYQELFNCQIHYNQKACFFQASSDNYDQPTFLAQPEIAAFCQEECKSLLAKLKGTDELIDSIRKIIVSSPGLSLRFNDVADQLAMGSRTLRRRLQERDYTFPQVRDEVREELAKEYLFTTNLTTDQISDRLGFSETPTFRRAFKKWTGMNIPEFRGKRAKG